MIVPLTGAVVVTGAGQAALNELAVYSTLPGRIVLLNPGAISWDTCDCNGMFAQAITRKNPTEVYPVDSSNLPNKGGCMDRSFMWSVQAVILRCVHGLQRVGDKAYFPTPDSLTSDSVSQQIDEYAVRKGITCYLQGLKDARPQVITDYRVGGSDYVGPEGNCGGILISYSFQVV